MPSHRYIMGATVIEGGVPDLASTVNPEWRLPIVNVQLQEQTDQLKSRGQRAISSARSIFSQTAGWCWKCKQAKLRGPHKLV